MGQRSERAQRFAVRAGGLLAALALLGGLQSAAAVATFNTPVRRAGRAVLVPGSRAGSGPLAPLAHPAPPLRPCSGNKACPGRTRAPSRPRPPLAATAWSPLPAWTATSGSWWARARRAV